MAKRYSAQSTLQLILEGREIFDDDVEEEVVRITFMTVTVINVILTFTLRELYWLVGIKSIRTSIYHPQTDGLAERLNKTLKSMICKFVHKDGRNCG